MEKYLEQLKSDLPKIIVVEKGRYKKDIGDFLKENNYVLIWKEKGNVKLSKTSLVFELKKGY